MKLGLEVFLENHINDYHGKRVGLVTNQTGMNQQLESTIDLFNEALDLRALFSPEHGIRGDVKEGEKLGDSVDEVTGLTVYSLYGKTRKPTRQMLEGLDVIFFDIQDIGSRYYTFIYTMAYVMEACQEYGKELVVLDRPNPINGVQVEGNLVQEGFTSFVGLYPIPNRHGMTIGELALMFNRAFDIDAPLRIIPMEGWAREYFFDELNLPWVPPSPNVTGVSMQLLYPGTCLIEGMNVSEGRGTVRPFEMVGAPFIDGRDLAQQFKQLGLHGVVARPVSFKPTYQKYANETCYGIQLHVMDRALVSPVELGVRLVTLLVEMYPNQVNFIKHEGLKHYFFDLLVGTDELRKHIHDSTVDQFINQMKKDQAAFEFSRKKYLIYN